MLSVIQEATADQKQTKTRRENAHNYSVRRSRPAGRRAAAATPLKPQQPRQPRRAALPDAERQQRPQEKPTTPTGPSGPPGPWSPQLWGAPARAAQPGGPRRGARQAKRTPDRFFSFLFFFQF